jgi:hypothetical protein
LVGGRRGGGCPKMDCFPASRPDTAAEQWASGCKRWTRSGCVPHRGPDQGTPNWSSSAESTYHLSDACLLRRSQRWLHHPLLCALLTCTSRVWVCVSWCHQHGFLLSLSLSPHLTMDWTKGDPVPFPFSPNAAVSQLSY